MKKIPARSSTAKPNQNMPRTLGQDGPGVIFSSIAVRKHTLAQLATEARTKYGKGPRGPVSGGRTIPSSTLAATKSLLTALILATARGAQIDLTKEEERPGLLERVARVLGFKFVDPAGEKGKAA